MHNRAVKFVRLVLKYAPVWSILILRNTRSIFSLFCILLTADLFSLNLQRADSWKGITATISDGGDKCVAIHGTVIARI